MANVSMTRNDSIVEQLEQLHQRIAQRAYDLFQSREGWGDPFGDWVRAELELVRKPAVEVREDDGTFKVAAALPGFDHKEITVDVTPREVVIKAKSEGKQTEHKGQIVRSEFAAGEVFRSVQFPKEIDAAKAKAEYQNGMLTITAPIAAEAKAKRVDIKAA